MGSGWAWAQWRIPRLGPGGWAMNNSGSRSGAVPGQPWDSSCPTQPISTTPGGKKQAPTVLSEDWGLQIPD